jgi:DNA transformation protein
VDELAQHLAELVAPLGRVTVRPFFGGHGFVVQSLQFAMLIDGILYLRADAALADELRARGAEPFRYQTRAREVSVRSLWSVPEAAQDDAELLVDWSRRALEVARAAKAGRGKSRAKPAKMKPAKQRRRKP